jgi:4-hydroxyphenylpyruvate dioxygenase-like putative hemolysin
MSDLLLHPEHAREPLQDALGDASNPLGLDGIEFIEYGTARPQALGRVLEAMGFKPVARHRSREVLLYRQGPLNVVVNANGCNLGLPTADVACASRWLAALQGVRAGAHIDRRAGGQQPLGARYAAR